MRAISACRSFALASFSLGLPEPVQTGLHGHGREVTLRQRLPRLSETWSAETDGAVLGGGENSRRRWRPPSLVVPINTGGRTLARPVHERRGQRSGLTVSGLRTMHRGRPLPVCRDSPYAWSHESRVFPTSGNLPAGKPTHTGRLAMRFHRRLLGP